MKIYTRTGDKGATSLYDGSRIGKNEYIFEVLGELDELSSRIGLLHSFILDSRASFTKKESLPDVVVFLRNVQRIIQDVNSIVATIKPVSRTLPHVSLDHIAEIEKYIDELDKENPKLTKFILPGVTVIDSQSQLCRTQARKVERFLWKLNSAHYSIKCINSNHDDNDIPEIIDFSNVVIDDNITKYFNRLSDFFFVLSRWLCGQLGHTDAFL